MPWLMVGGGVIWTWRSANPPETKVAQPEEAAPPSWVAMGTEQREAAAKNIIKKLMVEFPILAKRNPVQQEWGAAVGQDPVELELSKELNDISIYTQELDVELVKSLLAQHAVVVTEIERVGSLTGSSHAAQGFDARGTVEDAVKILLLKARIAAIEGDQAEAQRCVAMSMDFSTRMFHGQETFHGQFGVISNEFRVLKVVIKHLLPALGPDADVASWRKKMRLRKFSVEDYARMVLADWQASGDLLVASPDPEALARAYGKAVIRLLGNAPSMSLTDLRDRKDLLEIDAERLSKNAQKTAAAVRELGVFYQDLYLGAAIRAALDDATLQLLEAEQKGPVDAAVLRHLPVNPISGKPFAFHPDERRLSLPVTEK